MPNQGQNESPNKGQKLASQLETDNFVLEKDIFSNVFERDIRRVYIYKKAERLARAMHMVAPALVQSAALKDRADRAAIGLVDAAILPPGAAKEAMARELLALSSVLSIARTAGLLSPMNADLVGREARTLLQEIAAYEEPRVVLEPMPSLAELSASVRSENPFRADMSIAGAHPKRIASPKPVNSPNSANASRAGEGSSIGHKGHVSDTPRTEAAGGRREAILSILSSKGPSYIKDISTLIRDVSEKTIQRELGALIGEGKVTKSGERRWTTYSLAA